MKIKICGVKYRQNFKDLNELNPDYVGFIFYDKSERCVGKSLMPADVSDTAIKKVGVFVNADYTIAEKIIHEYRLQAVQFHGEETPGYCDYFRSSGIEVIKAFSVDEHFDFSTTGSYKNSCDLFLFDTKGEKKGGNGIQFNWRALNQYDQEVPFFLSGGIGPGNIQEALKIQDLNLYGVDVNSRIEDEPGLKNILKAKEIITIIKNANHEI